MKYIVALAIVLAAVLATSMSEAFLFRWTGNANNSQWRTAANWNPPKVPGAKDDVKISTGNVQVNGSVTIKSLLTSDTVSLTFSDRASMLVLSLIQFGGPTSINLGHLASLIIGPSINIHFQGRAIVNGPLALSGQSTRLSNYGFVIDGILVVNNNITSTGGDIRGPGSVGFPDRFIPDRPSVAISLTNARIDITAVNLTSRSSLTGTNSCAFIEAVNGPKVINATVSNYVPPSWQCSRTCKDVHSGYKECYEGPHGNFAFFAL